MSNGRGDRSRLWPIAAELGAWLALAGVMWIYSYQFDRVIKTYAFGPVGWPRGVIALMVVFAIASFLSQWRQLRLGGSAFPPTPDAGEEARVGTAGAVQLFAAFALPFFYLWLLPRAGFFATTPFFLAGYMFVFGIRHKRHLIGTTLAIYALVLLVFSRFLYVPLPTGNLPGFYEFSNALLILLAR